MKKIKKFKGTKVVGTEVIATIKVQPKEYFNAYAVRSGCWDDKTSRNRKNKAAQKERNALKKYIG